MYDWLKVILEALARQIDRLNGEIYIKNCEIERLKAENAELKNHRDALCRKESENA